MMSTPFTLPAGTITIHCRAPGPERRKVRRELKNVIKAFEKSQKTNLPIVGFKHPR